MAVVTKYGTGFKDPASLKAIDNVYTAGVVRSINSKIDIANGDSAASKYFVGSVPSQAILDPRGFFDYSAITGVNSMHLGFENSPAALVSADDVTLAGTQTLRGHGTLTLANSNKRAWELAGLAADPGGDLAILATINAAATAAGTVVFTLPYAKA